MSPLHRTSAIVLAAHPLLIMWMSKQTHWHMRIFIYMIWPQKMEQMIDSDILCLNISL